MNSETQAQGRGMLTPRIKEKSKELLGYEITQNELRLMVYVQNRMVNSQRIDPAKIDQEERELLSSWRKKGWIEGGASPMSITKEFWDAICEIVYLGYVDIDC